MAKMSNDSGLLWAWDIFEGLRVFGVPATEWRLLVAADGKVQFEFDRADGLQEHVLQAVGAASRAWDAAGVFDEAFARSVSAALCDWVESNYMPAPVNRAAMSNSPAMPPMSADAATIELARVFGVRAVGGDLLHPARLEFVTVADDEEGHTYLEVRSQQPCSTHMRRLYEALHAAVLGGWDVAAWQEAHGPHRGLAI
jgi:hypothetical protein